MPSDDRDIRPSLDELSEELRNNSRANEDLKESLGSLNRSIAAENTRASEATQHFQRAPAWRIHEELKPLRNIVEILALGADPLNKRYDYTGSFESLNKDRARAREAVEALSGAEKTMRTIGHEFARMFMGFGVLRAGRLAINAGGLARVPRPNVRREIKDAANALEASHGSRAQELIGETLDAAKAGLVDPKKIDNAFEAAGEIIEEGGRLSRQMRTQAKVQSALDAERFKVQESLEFVSERLAAAAGESSRAVGRQVLSDAALVGGGRAVGSGINALTESTSQEEVVASAESTGKQLEQIAKDTADKQIAENERVRESKDATSKLLIDQQRNDAKQAEAVVKTLRDTLIGIDEQTTVSGLRASREKLMAIEGTFERHREIFGEAGELELGYGHTVAEGYRQIQARVLPLIQQRVVAETDADKAIRTASEQAARRRSEIAQKTANLRVEVEEAANSKVLQRVLERVQAEIEALGAVSVATESHREALVSLYEDTANRLAEAEAGEQGRQARQEYQEFILAREQDFQKARIQLDEARIDAELRNVQRVLEAQRGLLASGVDRFNLGNTGFRPSFDLDQQASQAIDEAIEKRRELGKVEEQVGGHILNLSRRRSFEAQKLAIDRTRAEAEAIRSLGPLYEAQYERLINSVNRANVRLSNSVVSQYDRIARLAADAYSPRLIQNAIRETRQFIESIDELGGQYEQLEQAAMQMGDTLEQSLHSARVQEAIDGIRSGVQGLVSDFAGITFDHFWQSFRDGAQSASDSIQNFVQEGQDAIGLLESDILRINRFDEDSATRTTRLEKDRERRLAQLQRQRRVLLGQSPVGDQRAIERHRQRVHDLSARIVETRENFGVRINRLAEDIGTRRSRLLEDATNRRESFESRQTDASLLSKLGDSLASSVSSAISNALGGAVADLITSALSGQFTALTDAIKGLFGGSGDTQTTTATPATQGTDTSTQTTTPALEGDADVDGTIKTLTVDPALATPNIDVAGMIKSAVQAADGYTAASVEVVGSLKSVVVDATYSPITVDLKGLIMSVMLAPDLVLPTVHLKGIVNQLSVDPAAEIPTVIPNATLKQFSTDPAAIIPTVDTGATIKSLTVDVAVPSPQVDAVGTIKSLVLSADAKAPDITTTGRITSLVTDPMAVVPDVDMKGRISELTKDFTEPLPLQARADVALNFPDPSSLPPLDYSGLISPLAVPLTFTFDGNALTEAINALKKQIEAALSEGDETGSSKEPFTGKDDSSTPNPPSTPDGTSSTTAAVVAFEGRKDKVFGSDTTEQTSITPEELTKSLIEGTEEGTRSALHDLPRVIADGIGRLGSFILGSGLLGAGVGDTSSAAADQTNVDVAGSLKPEDSPRSDFVVTLPANPFTNQGTQESDDDDDSVARAPAAVRFDDPADALNTASNLISASALVGVAQDSTVASLGGKLDAIRLAMERVADQPLVEQLRAAGVVAPQAREDLVNSFLPDVLTQGGIAQLFNFENLFRNLTGQGIALPEGEGDATAGVATDVGEQIATLATEATLLTTSERLGSGLENVNQTLSSLATENTLASMGETLTQIQSATARMAEMPLVDVVSQLGERFLAGFENVNQTLTLLQESASQSGLNLGERQTDIPALMQSAQSLAGPAPNLAEIPGNSASNPLYASIVNQREVQDVRLVGGKVEVTNKVQAEVTNQVNVKHVGSLAVTQSGEWVMRLAGGGTIPVYVEGGRIVADIEGGLEGLALSLADEEVKLRELNAI